MISDGKYVRQTYTSHSRRVISSDYRGVEELRQKLEHSKVLWALDPKGVLRESIPGIRQFKLPERDDFGEAELEETIVGLQRKLARINDLKERYERALAAMTVKGPYS